MDPPAETLSDAELGKLLYRWAAAFIDTRHLQSNNPPLKGAALIIDAAGDPPFKNLDRTIGKTDNLRAIRRSRFR